MRPLFDANGACKTTDSAKYMYQVRVFPIILLTYLLIWTRSDSEIKVGIS